MQVRPRCPPSHVPGSNEHQTLLLGMQRRVLTVPTSPVDEHQALREGEGGMRLSGEDLSSLIHLLCEGDGALGS